MSMPPKKLEEQVPQPQVNKISITLTSRNTKSLEKVCADIISLAKNKKVKAKGPIRIPNKVLRITTRKSPCGEGTNTYDRFEMRIHKRVIHILSTQDFVKDMNTISIEAGVDVEVIMDKKEAKN
ncbi:40S ribosomal protein S20 [Dictyostelium purpureum]|uniref:Small ribosomal subunit protein uS10 n=1 Tax=Dictyostelium purpureum TaxID=5786 RepID=F0Z8U4_DICPU|nr:40S ribosomal protein S20 [Dictyostelium purpureum]EGC39636.1 40S ribosomal protein S20 [Dictyostelium purpureum]|eukprot:XP_003283857.1 40S ribosomal protein S20 [Dictyostelium purpureum]